MLHIYIIQKRESPPEVYSSYFLAATRCQSHLSAIAEKGSLSERYCLVLEELRVEALRQAKRMHPLFMTGLEDMDSHSHSQSQENGFHPASASASSMPIDDIHNTPTNTNETDLMGEAAIGFNDSIPTFSYADYSGWGHFASMVSSGLGNTDVFFGDSSLL
jgi:hypothetical protein